MVAYSVSWDSSVKILSIKYDIFYQEVAEYYILFTFVHPHLIGWHWFSSLLFIIILFSHPLGQLGPITPA